MDSFWKDHGWLKIDNPSPVTLICGCRTELGTTGENTTCENTTFPWISEISNNY